MKTAIIIPARLASTRFLNKPLHKLLGREMILHVAMSCSHVPNAEIWVATPDDAIKKICEGFRINTFLTSDLHPTGMDRIAEANKTIGADIIVNVQGDEPLIQVKDVIKVLNACKEEPDHVWNAYCPINNELDYANPTVVKVVTTPFGLGIYLSRTGIPVDKHGSFPGVAKRQVCIYAMHRKLLDAFAASPRTPLEQIEDIEILRFIELGYSVKYIKIESQSIAVDTPNDATRVEEILFKNLTDYDKKFVLCRRQKKLCENFEDLGSS